MRHRVGHRKLGRVTEHRLALLRNQAQALLRHERIETTVPKARELRPFVERLITIAKRSLNAPLKEGNGKAGAAGASPAPAAKAASARRGKAAAKGADKPVTSTISPQKAHAARVLHARRLVSADLHNKAVVEKLFDTIAPRFQGREGGYTRLLRVGHRRGDNAEVAQVELVGSEYNPNLDKPAEDTAAPAKAKGVRGRLQAAASRLRGGKKATEAGDAPGETAEAKPKARKDADASKKRAAKKTKDD